MSSPSLLRAAASVVAALSLVTVAGAGPDIPCPDGPDPIRFRPEQLVAPMGSTGLPYAWRADLAAAVDPETGREWIAVANVTPSLELSVVVSGDGGVSFGSAGGGLDPIVLDSGGADAFSPSIALRVDRGIPLLAVGWYAAGALRVGVETDWSGRFDVAVLEPAGVTPIGLDVAVAPAPADRHVIAAWIVEARALRVSVNTSEGAGAAWATPWEIPPPSGEAYGPDPFRAQRSLAIAADAAGLGGAGVTMVALTSSDRAFSTRSDDAGRSFAPWRAAEDGSLDAVAFVEVASSSGGTTAWTSISHWGHSADLAVSGIPRGDAGLVRAGVVDADFNGSSATEAVGEGPMGATAPVGTAVTGPPPGTHAWFTSNEDVVSISRRPLDAAGARLAGGCTGMPVTGIDPPGAFGFGSRLAALGSDVALLYVNVTRLGEWETWFKRSDSSPPVVSRLRADARPCGEPPSVELEWTPPPPDVKTIVVEVGTAPGATDFTVIVPPARGHVVDGLEPGRQYWFRVRVIDTAGNEAVSPEETARTPTCATAHIRSSVVAVSDSCPSPGGASGDGFADPGETMRVSVRMENVGTTRARGAVLRVISRVVEAYSLDDPVPGGDIDPGASVDVEAEVHASSTAACGQPFTLLLESRAEGAAWGSLTDLPRRPACTPCTSSATCSAVADASRSAPTTACGRREILLDSGGSSVSGCSGVLRIDWMEDGVVVGRGPTLRRVADATTTYRLVASCSTDASCRSTADVAVTRDAGPPAPAILRLAREPGAPGALRFTWTPTAGVVSTHVRSAADPRRLLDLDSVLEGAGALTLTAPMPPDRLRFYTAVSACSDDLGEGPP